MSNETTIVTDEKKLPSIRYLDDKALALKRFTLRVSEITSGRSRKKSIPNEVWLDVSSNRYGTENIFNKHWPKYSERIKENHEVISGFLDKYREKVLTMIPKLTGFDWPYPDIKIFSSLISWAGAKDNEIAIGVEPDNFIRLFIVPVLIHELIHINLRGRERQKNVRFTEDSEEIIDTLLVNKILTKLNKKYGEDLPYLRFSMPLRIYKKNLPELKNIVNGKKDYYSYEIEIDRFLKKHYHSAVYDRGKDNIIKKIIKRILRKIKYG